MSVAEIRFAEAALTDLQAVRDWYAGEDVPEIGDRFVSEIFDRVEMLGTHPEMGRVVPEFDQPFLRELIHPPYRIVYRCDPGLIRVVRIWRSERQLALPEIP